MSFLQYDKIFQKKKSGVTSQHSDLKACLDYVREGVLIRELMKEYELSKASVYRYLGGVCSGYV